MGCICSKGGSPNNYLQAENHHAKETKFKATRSSRLLGASLRKDEILVDPDGSVNDATTRLISDNLREENAASASDSPDVGEKNVAPVGKPMNSELQTQSTVEARSSGGREQARISVIGSITNGERGAQVAAGWPSWLTSVAAEAIYGWVPRKAESFEKLDKIGQGTYSSVYRARDRDRNKIVALKKVRFANSDPESVRFMAREVLVLRRLDHPNVMKLEGLITSRVSGSLYLIFEYMEHDLAGLAATPGIKFTEAQIKCYIQQLLRGLEHCHSQGVLHRDIKGSNLLIDNYGNLKIGDFGLAAFSRPHQKQPLTSRVVTLWYRPPELLLGATDYGVAVDLWSTGCIVAELFAGKPIMPGRTEVEQLHKIFKLCGSPSEAYWKKSKLPHATIFKPQHPYKRVVPETFKDFPSTALALLEVLLAVEPEARGTASSALRHEFFTTKPLPADPLALPKYPPSKEFAAKLRDEEDRRRRAAHGIGRDHESARRSSRQSKAVPAANANAELQESIQQRLGQTNQKCISEKFTPEEDGGSGFLIEPPKGVALNVFSKSGKSIPVSQNGFLHFSEDNTPVGPGQARGAELRMQRSHAHRGSAQLSRFSNSMAVRGGQPLHNGGEAIGNQHSPVECFGIMYDRLDDGESSEKNEWSHHLLESPKSSHKKDEQPPEKEFSKGYVPKKNRIHYSGPLMPPGGNLEEMLKEHEKQIQHAVRRARLDKEKVKPKKNYGDLGLTEALLHHERNVR